MVPEGAPLRVVVLDHTARPGGAELALLRVLDALPGGRAEVSVVLFEDGPLVGELRGRGHAVEVLPLDAGVNRRGRAIGPAAGAVAALRTGPFVLRLARLLRDRSPHLVHTTSLKADLVGLTAARIARLPVVWHVHDRIATDYLPAPVVGAFRAAARRGPAAVVANSSATAETLPGVRRLTVVHPGLGADQIRPLPLPPTASGAPRIGLVGRISPTKGQLEFVRAAAEVSRLRPDARFTVVGSALFGEDSYEQRVRSEVVRLGLQRVVDFAGFRSDVGAVLDGLSLLVHASTVPEPFGQVVVEAMARGVPVVATSAGGVPEILEDGRLGHLARPGDSADLARAISEALVDDHRDERVAEAWRVATGRYTADRSARQLLEVWEGVARQAR